MQWNLVKIGNTSLAKKLGMKKRNEHEKMSSSLARIPVASMGSTTNTRDPSGNVSGNLQNRTPYQKQGY